MKVKAYLEIYDEGGRLLHKQECRSFLANWMRIIYYSMRGEWIEVIAQDGGSSTIYSTSDVGEVFNVRAGAGDDMYGILVGSGTKAVEATDYCLESKIPHGSGTAGALEYGDTAVGALYVDGTRARFEITRTFTNSSGGDITISEVGLAVQGYDRFSGKDTSPLVERTVLDSPITVPDGSSITIKYTLEVTV